MFIPLGISVSIDALAIGFSVFNKYSLGVLLCYAVIIGLITMLLCILAFIISKQARKIVFIKRYGDYFGGVILFVFGLKMIIENLTWIYE